MDCTCITKLSWPAQSQLGEKAWKEWCQFIQQYLCKSHLELHQHLGRWLHVSFPIQLLYSQNDPSTNYYLYDENNSWMICRKHNRSRHCISATGNTTTDLPPSLVPITVRLRCGILLTKSFSLFISSPSKASPPMNSSLTRYFRTLSSQEQ